jgi:FAD/FMN-containing dehydrogenase
MPSQPASVLRPSSAEEARELFAKAVADGRRIIPCGRGRGLAPSRRGEDDLPDPSILTDRPGVTLLSLRRLDEIGPIEPGNLLAAAEAGALTDEVFAALEPTGLHWPVTGLSGRTLGGIMAEGRPSAEALARGSMPDWILGTTFLTALGTIVSSGGRTLKNVAGYDLTRLAWRSRGSLAICLGFTLKLIPKPKSRPVLEFARETTAEAAAAAEAALLSEARPEAVRTLGDRNGLKVVVWLAGFEEAVALSRRRIEAALGSPSAVRTDGFDWWREFGQKWPSPRPGSLVFSGGSRRLLLRLSAGPAAAAWRPDDGGPDDGRLDFDFGAGRLAVPVGSPLAVEAAAAGLAVDGPLVPSNVGPIFDRLKRALDPECRLAAGLPPNRSS